MSRTRFHVPRRTRSPAPAWLRRPGIGRRVQISLLVSKPNSPDNTTPEAACDARER